MTPTNVHSFPEWGIYTPAPRALNILPGTVRELPGPHRWPFGSNPEDRIERPALRWFDSELGWYDPKDYGLSVEASRWGRMALRFAGCGMAVLAMCAFALAAGWA